MNNKSTRKKVAVALSGGVDSSTTAVLLKEQGYDIIAVTGIMQDDSTQKAREVCEKFGFEHHVLDLRDEFQKNIIDYFKDSYAKGFTPNPCIVCNKKIKWGRLFDFAINNLGVDYFATGHYAQKCLKNGDLTLKKAKDSAKDQIYFLFELTQKQLSQTLFPMGEFEKSEVREIAQKYDIPSKNTKDSQDICFLMPPDNTKKYLLRTFGESKGDFIHIETGKVLGAHNGSYQFTVGQRKGIGIADKEPLYVIKTDIAKNLVYVGYKRHLFSSELELTDVNFLQKDYINREFTAFVKIRYNSSVKPARIIPDGDVLKVVFDEPQTAITKGQAGVIYDDECLIGGGWIQ